MALLREGPGSGKAQATRDGVALRTSDLSKTFPGTRALSGVDLEVRPGEIHALVGQNGSGKSTLIKVLAGYHRPDPGSKVWIYGDELTPSEASAGHPRLRFVHQDLGLFAEMSAVDNVALRSQYSLSRWHRIRWEEQRRRVTRLLEEFELDLDVDRPVSEASPVQRTIVAIAAALAIREDEPTVLVLDEPTAVLPSAEAQHLLETVKQLRERGDSVLYVSHRLDEVLEIADRVTVLRGGEVVASRDVAGMDGQGLAELLVGDRVDANYRCEPRDLRDAPVVLRARGVRGRYLAGMDLELREGEVVGIAGLPGSGREELPYAIAGMAPDASGEIWFGDAWMPLKEARRLNIPLVPADRGSEGVIDGFSVAENISISTLDSLATGPIIRHSSENAAAEGWIDAVQLKASSPDAGIDSLSGGNQQKAVIARCLMREPRVLSLCEPTAGVDVGARRAIYELILERARAGLGVIVASTDVGDLLAVCTRVLVLCNGLTERQLDQHELDEATLIRAMEETRQV